MGDMMGVRSIAMPQGLFGCRVHLLAGAIIAGFALGFAATSHAAPAPATANAEEAPGRPVKLNTFNKRSAKPAIVTKRKVAKTTAVNSKYATKRGAKYSRVASRVQKASQKFQASQTFNAAAQTSAPASQPQQPRTPSAVSTFAGDSLKPLVADAHAEMSAADLKASGAAAVPYVVSDASVADASASQAPIQVAAADQLNDIDRAAAAASNDAANGRPGQVMKPVNPERATVASTDSTWDQTSLIGKLFVAFGGLLTLASAARMFMA